MPKGVRPPNAGKGRVKGSKNKMPGDLRAMIMEALDGAGGVDYLKAQAKDNPQAFMSLVGRAVPKEINGQLTGDLLLRVVTGVPDAKPND